MWSGTLLMFVAARIHSGSIHMIGSYVVIKVNCNNQKTGSILLHQTVGAILKSEYEEPHNNMVSMSVT